MDDNNNKNTSAYGDSEWCMGFIDGISQMEIGNAISAMAATGDKSNDVRKYLDYCSPKDVTLGQDMRIVVKYLKDNPEKLNQFGASLVLEALRRAFPCPRN